MNFIGIIPSRYASVRLPGKPLIKIKGKTMIKRVYERVDKVLNYVLVATDDERIKKEVENFGGNVVMTSTEHQSGTDRCAEALKIFENKENKKFDIIINIQGDEPFIHSEQIKSIQKCFQEKDTQIATLVKKITKKYDIFDENKPKVIFNKNKEAIYFSRFPIPFFRNENKISEHSFYKHIGMYAYRKDILKKITKLSPSTLEKAESLEQLRWIENNFKIKIEITNLESISIDTKEDLEKLKNL